MDTLTMERPPTQLEDMLAQQQELIAELRAENARLRAESDRLVAENGELRELVAQLQERIAELESKLGPPGKGTPEFAKPSRKKDKKEGPRKKRSENFARKRDEPTQRIIHALEECTSCGCRLLGARSGILARCCTCPLCHWRSSSTSIWSESAPSAAAGTRPGWIYRERWWAGAG